MNKEEFEEKFPSLRFRSANWDGDKRFPPTVMCEEIVKFCIDKKVLKKIIDECTDETDIGDAICPQELKEKLGL